LVRVLVAQPEPLRELVGRVVELREGNAVGVAQVKVSIEDFDYDVTDAQGFFKLALPPQREHVSVVLENSPAKMVSPYSGLVNLPPERDFRIVVCGEENRRLNEKVGALNSRIKKLERDKKLSARQLQALHQALLDTILHYEGAVGKLRQELQRATDKNAAQSAEMAAKDARIRALEDSVGLLVQALGAALETRFLQQKTIFDAVSADFSRYVDRLKDLRDWSTEPKIAYPFRSPQASEQLSKKIGEYNAVRNAILENNQANALAAGSYWDNPGVAEALAATYRYLLKEVHEARLLPLDNEVFGQVREVATNRAAPGRAQKKAEAAAETLVPALNTALADLEKRIQQTMFLMATSN
jgi:chromosome segregation ATPase